MRRLEAATLTGLMFALWIGGVTPALGEPSSDRPAALMIYPLVIVNDPVVDTVVQISNTSQEPVDVRCFYENVNGHCSNSGSVCYASPSCCGPTGCGICIRGWNEEGFQLRLTPRQPLGWAASRGLRDFPLDGEDRTGPDGSSNRGSRIPAVAERPFVGLLKCLAVDETGRPVETNVLTGAVTITSLLQGARTDVARYNAIGLPAIEGANNGDKILLLGGSFPEYEGCPTVLMANHFFDLALNPVSGLPMQTSLVLAPCTQDLLRQFPGAAVVQYVVYNEFEQRFSTSSPMAGLQTRPIALIDTRDPFRSIFSVGAAGTLTGQTMLKSIGSGLVGLGVEMHGGGCLGGLGCGVFPLSTAAFHLYNRGDRTIPDLIILP